MVIEVNGEAVELGEGASLADAVVAAGAAADRRGVAAAVNGEIVPRAAWDTRRLDDGAEVEVVTAVQGG